MKKYKKYLPAGKTIVLSILPLLLLLASCVREGLDPCEEEITEQQVFLVLSVVNIEGEDITDEENLDMVDLFIFNPDRSYYTRQTVSAEDIRARKPVSIKHVDPRNLWVAAWANLGENQTISEMPAGCIFDDLQILMKLDETGYGISPDDLFFGVKQVYAEENLSKVVVIEEVIPLKRKNASLYITVRGLPDDCDPSDYYFLICQKNNGYSLPGIPVSGPVRLKEYGELRENRDFVSSGVFNVIHTVSQDQNITLEFYEKKKTRAESDSLIFSVTEDINKRLIAPLAGETTNVMVDLSDKSRINVYIEITPWDEIYNWEIW